MLSRKLFARFATEAVNYYKLFNIPVNFTEQELKTAYLELVKIYHPDLSKETNAAQMFRLVQEGYATLSDVTERNKYQQTQKQVPLESEAQSQSIIEELRSKYFKDYKRKDPINDEFNFTYKMFKEHYEKVEQPKAQYRKYEGQNQSYYAKKDEVGEKAWKQVAAGSAAVLIIMAAYFYTNN